MSGLVHEFLLSWEAELLQLRANDPLIDLPSNAFVATEVEFWSDDTNGRQIRREARRIERERGVIALVHFEGLLTWQKGDKTIQTPVFLRECSAFNHQTQKLNFEENVFVNPYIGVLLQKTGVSEIELKNTATYIQDLLNTKLFTHYDARSGLANLHPQRYELRKEWEALTKAYSYSAALQQIIGDPTPHLEPINTRKKSQIGPLDPDQKAAIDQTGGGSVVIYGPPGTGKSVVLSNLIGQVIFNQQNALVVADKPVALQVLLGKLAQHQLDQCCVLLKASQTNAGFYKQLQVQFERLLQDNNKSQDFELEQPFLGAAFWQQRRQIERESGKNFSELIQAFGPPKQTNAKPSKRWQLWLSKPNLLANLRPTTRKVLPLLNSYWQKTDTPTIRQDWDNWQKWSHHLLQNHGVQNSSELDTIVNQSLLCIQFEGNLYQTYSELLDQNQAQQLKRLYKYQQLCIQEEQLRQTLQVWKQLPTLAEWAILQVLAVAPGWLNKRKWKKLEKTWLRLPGLDLQQLDTELKIYWHIRIQRTNLKEKFARFGIQNLDEVLGLLVPLLKQHNFAHWQWYRKLSPLEIQVLCQTHQSAHQFQQLHQQLFTKKELNFSILQLTINVAFAALNTDLHTLKDIHFELWEDLTDLNNLHQILSAEFWADLRVNYPSLYSCSPQQFTDLIETDLLKEEQNWTKDAAAILAVQRAQFRQMQKLLTDPIQKLTNDQKDKRLKLRKGKAVMVKEMAKTRQHLSIAQLFEGPAAPWLRVIFPVWLCTPTTLAKSLPLKRELFNVGIFDEASQLPLSHAIGALQRVTTVVVAGDPQQMRPQSYFGQSAEGVVDLLHQAAFYLPSKHLRYHYRSEDPSLIAFSNRHFYNNSLIVWPSKASVHNGIFDHYIEAGRYIQQKNNEEAKILAQHLHTLLPLSQTIGVVAFSENQLNCIYQALNNTDQVLLDERIQERSCFFLPLEKVQGEECEILLISFGFAKNDAEQFSLKLGPMAQAQSGRRLNVLLTRAQKSLHFYSSIRSSDFPTQRSAATNRLWEWFVFLENTEITQATYDAQERLDSGQDYPTFLNYYRVLKQRGALASRV